MDLLELAYWLLLPVVITLFVVIGLAIREHRKLNAELRENDR